MRSYSERALAFLWKLLPRYMEKARIDFASFRPQEEEGRDLPTKKRNDLLHVDAFPTRPTRGDMILRFFTNIHPSKPRVWMTSDPMGALAPRYANDAGLAGGAMHPKGSIGSRMLGAFGGVEAKRSAYDRFMLGFHDYLKFNGEYQESCAKYRFEFPPDSTWMVFTDVVPHAVLSGPICAGADGDRGPGEPGGAGERADRDFAAVVRPAIGVEALAAACGDLGIRD